LSVVDIILALIILAGAFAGYKDGFITSLFSLVAMMLGMLAGFKLMGRVMVFFVGRYNVDEKVLPFIAFGVVFVLIVVLVGIVGRLIKASLNKPILGPVDPVVGALLGLVRATFMLSIMLWIADSLRMKFPEDWMGNSWLHPITANFAPKVVNWISGFLPIFSDVL